MIKQYDTSQRRGEARRGEAARLTPHEPMSDIERRGPHATKKK
jgi:hypothetical protein